MIIPASVRSIVASFQDLSDGHALKSRELILLLLDCSLNPFSRSQFTPGHITCTGFVLAPDGERLLIVLHRRLGRWLLPGGHVAPSDAAIGDAARREVLEETGADLLPDPVPLLVSMDVHGIPSNGSEPYHLHHDLLFAFQSASDAIRCSPESREVRWCAPAEFDRYGLPDNIRRAYARVARR
ncbi:MAG TPA: NUDIX domain-containing protein [Bryobacteraceae bacterium]|jgi:8-oxo-dGTP pyrophosphatase MutT (NUDIX family)|nr:NUDIX domain-containing protein [Bryobacteraceae bacterium]